MGLFSDFDLASAFVKLVRLSHDRILGLVPKVGLVSTVAVLNRDNEV